MQLNNLNPKFNDQVQHLVENSLSIKDEDPLYSHQTGGVLIALFGQHKQLCFFVSTINGKRMKLPDITFRGLNPQISLLYCIFTT